MRINTNIAALRSCYQLHETDEKVSASLSKLTSGNKLINIKDNPVGASLSVKMKTQIRNLDRASQNTSDGISVIETAEGALAEIQSMLQRINELAVQGASDSYTDEDRESIMAEVNQIKEGIDRISNDTNFNTLLVPVVPIEEQSRIQVEIHEAFEKVRIYSDNYFKLGKDCRRVWS